MRLVLVEWIDSYGCSPAWESLSDCQPKLMQCRSVGWLLHDGDDCKVIIPHLSERHDDVTKQGCGDMTIPSRAVLRMIDLADPGKGDSNSTRDHSDA